MSVLILGTGAREHALGWALKRDPSYSKPVYIHPGNGGTELCGFPTLENVPIEKLNALTDAAKRQDISLVIIGPEALLAKGYADAFRQAGFLVLGPGRSATRLESSKVFAKQWMQKAGIPTARFSVVSDEASLLSAADRFPIVLKFDGLAAGKGVVIAQTKADVRDFAKRVWSGAEFGEGPKDVVVEECLPGRELSYMGLCDGKTFLSLATATDYKRIRDQDEGPNTGGMGAVSPSPWMTTKLEERIREEILVPFVAEMQRDRMDFRGVLFAGLMVAPDGKPWVLEFNVRFGDPETQAVMMRLRSSPQQVFHACASGTLDQLPKLEWDPRPSVYVVAASKGYPENPTIGVSVSGFEPTDPKKDEQPIFSAGLALKGKELLTSGGRVLGVGALGQDVLSARQSAYHRLKRIHFDGMHFRKDIADF